MTISYKGISHHREKDKEKWLIFENTHPAIISKEDFQEVQEIRKQDSSKRQNSMKETEKERAKLVDLFEKKLFCGDCGKRMYFKRQQDRYHGINSTNFYWRGHYNCSTNVRRMTPPCTPHQLQQKALHETVLNAIKTQVKVATDYEALLKKLKNSTAEKSVRDKQNALISSLTLKLNTLKKKREGLYSDYSEGVLDLDEYTFAKETYDNQYSALSLQLDEAQLRKKEFVEAMSSNNKWITLMKSVSKAKKLNQHLIDTVVEKVFVYEDGSIEVVFNYNDIFILMESGIKSIQGEVA